MSGVWGRNEAIITLRYKRGTMKARKISIFLCLFILTGLVLTSGVRATVLAGSWKELKEKEAEIWYLGHSGWAIKTKKNLLIFDYWGHGMKVKNPVLSFGAENRDVYVFVSHNHSDHFDPVIFEWEKVCENIHYIFGWQVSPGQKTTSLEPREKEKVNNLEILTIKSTDKGVGFLVNVDGLVIFHAGDHENGEGIWEAYAGEIEFISQNVKSIDLAFIPVARDRGKWRDYSNKGSFYLIEKLQPKLLFPMHALAQEQFYKEFASEAGKKNFRTTICCAEKLGDRFFFYDDGIIDQSISNE